MKTTQNERVLRHLKDYGTITAWEDSEISMSQAMEKIEEYQKVAK